jgi:hypothetical protein
MTWETKYVPSWLVLKQHGPRKAIVIRVHPQAALGNGKARMYEAWLNGKKVGDPVDTCKVGQVIDLEP